MTDERDWVISPGDMLRDWMSEQGPITVKMTAVICGRMPIEMMQRVLDGEEPITPTIAEALAHGTGIPRKFWLRLETAFRSGLAAGKVHTQW